MPPGAAATVELEDDARGGRPNRVAAALNRLGAMLWSAGLGPSRMVTMEVV